ncbi:hypothetical protein [Citricoccus muralis]|uniref:Asparagine synthase n=1 Tax=Citricoccus muralis TaxID=169134 RepID=A0ABY8H9C4_9MICC|nr:hypothetical protein [Citricoccus muralis]WFP17766.1 hypothetical protein P8192_06630 [Citricoccus muralis]
MSSSELAPPVALLVPSNATALTRQPARREWPAQSPIVEFSGVTYGAQHANNGRFGDNNLDSATNLGEIRDSLGEWVSVVAQNNEESDEFLVLADRFAYKATYYSHVPGEGLLLSDSFDAVSQALTSRARRLDLDLENYVTTIISNVPTFRNPISSSTMVTQISLLEPDEAIEITPNTARIVDRSVVGGTHDIQDYTHAIQKGIEFAQQLLQHVSTQEGLEKRLTLSGGVDSRLALALLYAAGVHHDFQIFTEDPRTWSNNKTIDIIKRDIQISNAIREAMGMQWWIPPASQPGPSSLAHSLASHQAISSNLYYQFESNASAEPYPSATLTVRGGGGELLRSTRGGSNMSRHFRKVFNGGESQPSSVCHWIASTYIDTGKVSAGFTDFAVRYLANSIGETDAPSLEQRLNEYYFRTRNRAHFSIYHRELLKNDHTLQILSNPFFLRAGQLISFQEKANGKLVKDIFNLTAPHLLDYAFEDDTWTQRLASPGAQKVSKTDNSWIYSYDHQVKVKTDPITNVHRSGRDSNQILRNNETQLLINYLKEGFVEIENFSDPRAAAHLRNQHDLVLHSIMRGRNDLHNTTVKMLSAVTPLLLNRGLLEGSYDELRVSSSASPSRSLWRSESQCLVNTGVKASAPIPSILDTFIMQPTICYKNNCVIVDCRPIHSREAEMHFAVYLMRDDERVSESWYKPSPVHSFPGSLEPGTYSAIAFARYATQDRPLFQERSHSLKITTSH